MSEFQVNILKEQYSDVDGQKFVSTRVVRIGDTYYLCNTVSNRDAFAVMIIDEKEVIQWLLQMRCSPEEAARILKEDKQMQTNQCAGDNSDRCTCMNSRNNSYYKLIYSNTYRRRYTGEMIHGTVFMLGNRYFIREREVNSDSDENIVTCHTLLGLQVHLLNMGMQPEIVAKVTAGLPDNLP